MTRTLSDVVNQNVNQPSQSGNLDTDVKSFNTFLASFNIQLVHRFPDVSDIDLQKIDYDQIRAIGEFCAATDMIAHQVWTEFSQPLDQKRRFRQTRSA